MVKTSKKKIFFLDYYVGPLMITAKYCEKYFNKCESLFSSVFFFLNKTEMVFPQNFLTQIGKLTVKMEVFFVFVLLFAVSF